MNALKKIILNTLAALLISLPVAYANIEIETLRNVKGINVVIDVRIPEEVNITVNKEIIKRQVESLLKKEGIPLLSEEDFFTVHGSARLWLTIRLAEYQKKDDVYAYNIELELRQNVLLERNKKISFSAPTWEVSVTGVMLRNYVEETIENSVKRLMRRFLKSYATANPSKSARPMEEQSKP